MNEKQIKIQITVDEDRVADFLREVATAHEESLDNDMTYETSYGIAEIKEE